MAQLVEKLKNFISIHNEKRQVEETISSHCSQISQHQMQIDKLSKLAIHEQANFRQLQKSVDASQLDLEILREEEAKRRKQLAEESNGETIRLLSIEVSRMERKRISAENALEELWHEMEKSRNNLKLIQEQSSIRIGDIEEKIAEIKNSLAAEKVKIESKDLEIKNILSVMPTELKEQILSMEKNSTAAAPIAPVVQNVCGACFYPLSTRDVGILAQNNPENVLTCQNCFTILYTEPAA